jgi:serine/threonine protein kinase
MILQSDKFGQLQVDDAPFATGGAGWLFRANTINSGTTYCVKLLVSPKPDDFEKLRYMVDNPPASLVSGWGRLCWPSDIVSHPASNTQAGFVMAMAETGSLELSNLTVLRWPTRSKSVLSQKLDRCTAAGMTRRMQVACNLAAAVQEVHRMGCVFVDLKPQNVLISQEGAVSLVDLDSLQVASPSKTYRGPLGSPEYMPPESYGLDFSTAPVITTSWDLFSLAVIIYEMLLGIHPFTATANPYAYNCDSIEESIRFGLYVHGKNRASLSAIPAPHDSLKSLPAELAELFLKAFDGDDPSSRPTCKEWGEALNRAAVAGSLALSTDVYSPRPPSSVRGGVVTSVQASSSGVLSKPCVGEPAGACPEELAGRVQYGVPNSILNLVGVYYCPRCMAKKTNAISPTSTSPCHGPYGKSCPHEGEKPSRPGIYRVTLSSGNSVYLCESCFMTHNGKDAPQYNYKPKEENELFEFVKEWGWPIAAVVGGGYFLYQKINKNKKRR